VKKKFVLYYNSGWVGAEDKETIEIETDQYKSKEELEDYLNDEAQQMMWNRAECGWYPAEEEEG
jgi:hypothetical protein